MRYVAIQDVGRAINPALVEAQMHGGAVQGVGWGLYEQMVFDEQGTPITGSFMDYTLPKASQSPDLEAVLVEVPSSARPLRRQRRRRAARHPRRRRLGQRRPRRLRRARHRAAADA